MSISRDIPLDERFVVEMSPEDYEALPPDNRHEYVDGCLIVNPRGTFDHQLMLRNLTTALQAAVPGGYVAINEWAWKPGADEWAPDVMVVELTERAVRYTGIPELIVEVLSTNRADDLVRKLYRYAAAGLPRYWLADPLEPSIRGYILQGGIFELLTEATGDDEVTFDLGIATVQLRPSDLMRLDYP